MRQRTLRLVFGDCRFIYCHSSVKSPFLLSKGLLCLYDKQNNNEMSLINRQKCIN